MKKTIQKTVVLCGLLNLCCGWVCMLALSGCMGNRQAEPLPAVTDLDGAYILRNSQGDEITTLEAWEERRKDIYDYFADNLYGRMPEGEVQVSHQVKREDKQALKGQATLRIIEITLKRDTVERKMDVILCLPNALEGKPAPAFMGFWFMPMEEIVKQGYASVAITMQQVYPDNGMRADMKNRQDDSILALWGIRSDADTKPNTGQMIACYGWAVSRVVDYLETVPEVDAKRLVLTGCSRAGKAAVWAAANEPRLAMIAISQSGGMGAALTRYQAAGEEPMQNLADLFPHWFCPRFYTDYTAEANHTQFDQDALLALIAPRPVYICSSVEYKWGDPTGEFLALRNVGPVYELYGFQGLGIHYPPAINAPVMERVGYHDRIGPHSISEYDWQQFFLFAKKWL